jgi:Domain of unknown function (DUF4157)
MRRKAKDSGAQKEPSNDDRVVRPVSPRERPQPDADVLIHERAHQALDAAQGGGPEGSSEGFGALLGQLSQSESVKAAVVRQLQHRYGNRYVRRMLQGGRRVSSPTDAHEREAEQAAERATRADADAVNSDADAVNEEATERSSAELKSKVLRSAKDAGQAAMTDAPPVVRGAIQAPGQPLDARTREEMETRLGGEDFSSVRVHTDERASDSARELDADAYTVGREVVFGAGRYSPQTDAGRRLLAHELAHVAQTRAGSADASVIHRQPAGGGGAGSASAAERNLGVEGAGPGTEPAPVPELTPEEKRAQLLSRPYQSEEERFSMDYLPGDGKGSAQVTVFVYVDFLPFTQETRKEEPYAEYYKTHKQPDPKDCDWTQPQTQKFMDDLISSVGSGWSRKHTLACAEKGLEDVTASLDVEVRPIESPDLAHVKVAAQKTPPATPRLPAHRNKGDATGVLDWRDPSEPSTIAGQKVHLGTAQIGPFEPGKSTLTKELTKQVNAIPGGPLAIQLGILQPAEVKEILLTGWACTTNNSEREDATLAFERASSVKRTIDEMLGWATTQHVDVKASYAGRQLAKPEPQYQRVVVEVVSYTDSFSQNTAAHEFGHLFAGLGDEYSDPYRADGLPGDKPAHYDRVKEEMGESAANDLLVGNNASIMSGGNVVKPGHYVAFVEAMRKMTGLRWTVK